MHPNGFAGHDLERTQISQPNLPRHPLNKPETRRGGRTALSALMATVILVAITLVAGVALYEYLISGQAPSTQSAARAAASVVNSAGGNPQGSFYATAQVSASGVSCSNGSGVCTIQLTNTGSANTQANGCIFSGNGGGAGNLSPNLAELTAGSSTEVTCTGPSGHGNGSGTQVTGSILLSNGASVAWTGTWQ